MLQKNLLLSVLFVLIFKTAFGEVIKDSITNTNILTTTKTITKRTFKEFDDILKTNTLKYKHNNSSEFNADYINSNYTLDAVTNDQVLEAKAVMDELEVSQNYIDLVSPDDLVTLPVGVKKEIGNITYTLGISKATFTPQYTEVTAFVKIVIPQTDSQNNQKKLFFGTNKLRLSHEGGIYGDANLVLLGDVPIPINGGNSMVVLKGGFNMETGNVENLTYVTVDCQGFKELGITAEVLFPRTMLEPVDNQYNLIPNEDVKVKGEFQMVASDWNDILAEVTLPPFQLTKEGSADGTGKGGLVFELNTAVFDFSDLRNSPEVNFPEGYSQYLIPGNEELWRGVYVNSLSVVLPKQFKKKQNQERVVFQASNLLIDGMGVSGNFSVDNILPINEGDASKWQFSVDHIEVEIVTNSLVEAGFDGKIVLPVSEGITEAEMQSADSTAINKKALKYDALIDPINDEYTLTVTSQDSLSFNVFKAKAILEPNSYVEMKVLNNKFKPKAVLHGSLSISGSNSETNPNKKTVDFKGVTFDNLQLQTEDPYFMVDHMGYTGEVKFANFPVTLSDIGVTANSTEASLQFGIDINLMADGFSGGTTLSVVGNYAEDEGIQRWQYDRLDIDRISIAADLGKIQIEGHVDIKDDDPVYGDGFYGELGATFNGIDVDASAWFGKTDFRYWYVDAFVDLSGLPPTSKPTIGPVQVNGFGGGAYYRMTKQAGDYSAMVPSGMSYVPSATAGIGFRALLGFALPSEKAFNGKVGFEMAFNNSGGLNRVLFFGEAHIIKALDFQFGDQFKDKLTKMENKINGFGENNSAMTALKDANLVEYSKLAFPQEGLTFDVGIDANFSMEMDFENDTFHSIMEVYLNTPGGLFKGIGPQGRVGQAIFHADPESWYLHVGTPDHRVGTRLGIGSFSLENGSYLMVGDNIPGSPPPPANVAEILGTDLNDLDYMRDLNALGNGSGFAFGTNFSIDTGDMKFLIFYAKFQAGLGFDIMVKDYGDTACSGSGQIGIDGWYANGQAYAYLQGELGINVKLLFIKKKIPILSAGAAVLLQAKLPNPAWFRGYVGGNYNVLGGLVKGNFRFKVELGEECDIINGGPLEGLKVISDINPSDTATNVDVFSVPQTVFNMKVNTPFELEDDIGVKTYRILMDDFAVTNEGTPIPGDLEWNDNSDKLNFVPFDVFPPNTLINVRVSVNFQELRSGNWVTITENGQAAIEEEEISFTTGEAPDYIPLTNIAFCYPVVDQDYFYKDERSTGYVKLKQGQPYLFSPQTDWSQSISFSSVMGTQPVSNLAYNAGDKMLNFGLPELSNEVEYTLNIKSTPSGQSSSNDSADDNYTAQQTGQDGNTIEVRNREAEVVTQEGEEVEVLAYTFTTSEYNTFAEKINDKQASQYFLDPIYSDVHALQVDVQPSERFSVMELNGVNYTNNKPLVQPEAVLDDNYYNNAIYQLLYQGYPLSANLTLNRDVAVLGAPPVKAIETLTWYSNYLEAGIEYPLLDTRIPYRYHLPYYYKHDFIDLRYKIVNAYSANDPEYQNHVSNFDYIINGPFPAIYSGDYNVKMQYVLPGNIQQGTSTIFKFNNPY